MRHPHARYIQALILARLSEAAIKANLQNLGLRYPPKADIAQLEAEILSQADPALHTYLKTPSAKLTKDKTVAVGILVKRLKVLPYFDKTGYNFDTLIGILRSPEVRDAIEGLLLTNMQGEEIVTLVNRTWSKNLTKEDLIFYRDLFWDTTQMDTESWAYFFMSCSPKGCHIRAVAIRHPDKLEVLRYLVGVPSGEEMITPLQRHFIAASYHMEKAWDALTLDLPKLTSLSNIMVKFADRVKKWGGDHSKDMQKHARMVLDENRVKNQSVAAALIVRGALPDIPDVAPKGAYKPVGT